MPIGDKYSAITKFLELSNSENITMTFSELDHLCPIPPSAFDRRSLWGNSGQSFSISWMNAGYRTQNVRMREQIVEFIKVDSNYKASDSNEHPKISEKIVTQLIAGGQHCLENLRSDEHHRYRSWEYCFKAFSLPYIGAADQKDYLALQLSWYLASWGMLRNSFLQDKDYKIQIPIVELLMDHEWDDLRSISFPELQERSVARKVMNLSHKMSSCYQECCGGIPTATLISKVLLGTLGCVPAYDRFLVSSLRYTGVASGIWGENSLMSLGRFYSEHIDQLEDLRKKCKSDITEYTQAKVIDMCFFGFGQDNQQTINKL